MVNVFAKVEKSERNTKYGEEKSTEGQKYDTVDDTVIPRIVIRKMYVIFWIMFQNLAVLRNK